MIPVHHDYDASHGSQFSLQYRTGSTWDDDATESPPAVTPPVMGERSFNRNGNNGSGWQRARDGRGLDIGAVELLLGCVVHCRSSAEYRQSSYIVDSLSVYKTKKRAECPYPHEPHLPNRTRITGYKSRLKHADKFPPRPLYILNPNVISETHHWSISEQTARLACCE
jgi:hypothetical protein